tara:strand:- start:603 stop:917 length:315 start_codon:yes stop_codon:yes gene_type:complete
MSKKKRHLPKSKSTGKYCIRAMYDDKKHPLVYVDTLEEADEWIDLKLFGSKEHAREHFLARTELQKRKGRMTKDSEIIDYWLVEDWLATAPFKILVLKTEDLPK